jgi:hypothetical protein
MLTFNKSLSQLQIRKLQKHRIRDESIVQINYSEIIHMKPKITKTTLTLRFGDKTKITTTILTPK